MSIDRFLAHAQRRRAGTRQHGFGVGQAIGETVGIAFDVGRRPPATVGFVAIAVRDQERMRGLFDTIDHRSTQDRDELSTLTGNGGSERREDEGDGLDVRSRVGGCGCSGLRRQQRQWHAADRPDKVSADLIERRDAVGIDHVGDWLAALDGTGPVGACGRAEQVHDVRPEDAHFTDAGQVPVAVSVERVVPDVPGGVASALQHFLRVGEAVGQARGARGTDRVVVGPGDLCFVGCMGRDQQRIGRLFDAIDHGPPHDCGQPPALAGNERAEGGKGE